MFSSGHHPNVRVKLEIVVPSWKSKRDELLALLKKHDATKIQSDAEMTTQMNLYYNTVFQCFGHKGTVIEKFIKVDKKPAGEKSKLISDAMKKLTDILIAIDNSEGSTTIGHNDKGDPGVTVDEDITADLEDVLLQICELCQARQVS